jgi:tetraacyldisaccharide 4'-kinase
MKLTAPNYWYKRGFLCYLLSPVAGLYRIIIFIRRLLKKAVKFKVPIIVVGNITVGGTGKTPLVIWLADFLQKQGLNPGIVSRGYGAHSNSYPCLINENSNVKQVGDEAILISRRTHCPMVIAPNRVAAVEKLLAINKCDVIISDDGLQHYALARDIEIALIDGFGNGFCLPAGPLREPKKRLQQVDLIVQNGEDMQLKGASKNCHPRESEDPEKPCNYWIPAFAGMTRRRENVIFRGALKINNIYNLKNPKLNKPISEFSNTTVHAVAGIGNPQKFFNMLRGFNIKVIAHPFPDHHNFTPHDLWFRDDLPILMTEKDAVKCSDFTDNKYWCVTVQAKFDDKFINKLLSKLKHYMI